MAASAATGQLVLLLAAGAAGAGALVAPLSVLVELGVDVLEPESVLVDELLDVEVVDFPPRLSVL